MSDGTEAGTVLVKDVMPQDDAGSRAEEITPVGKNVFFAADDGVHGRELWVSDGTEGGTAMVDDLNPGPTGSQRFVRYEPFELGAVGQRLFFTADDGVHGAELWVSDGTPAGTSLVEDINATAAGTVSPGTTDQATCG